MKPWVTRTDLSPWVTQALAKCLWAVDLARLHRFARRHAEKRKAQGAEFDKKQLRWNDIVAVGVFYGRCGAEFDMDAARGGVQEAVDSCIKNWEYGWYAGGTVLGMIQSWMISCEVPE